MNDTFLRACKGEPVDYTPVWLMRQAGRYMSEYREVRAKAGDFLSLCKNPELACEVSLQPIEKLGVDAAILFSDILVIPEAMGQRLEFLEGEGPALGDPIRSRELLDKLSVPDPYEALDYVMQTIKLLRAELKVPLIGFSGAPYTLATYMIEGGSSKNFVHTKRMMYQAPVLYSDLMEMITKSVTLYLRAQIRSGAQAVQIFDTWAGMLSPHDFRLFVLPYVQKIVRSLKREGVPIIYFVNGGAGMLKDVKKSGADVIGLDWRIDMADGIKAVGKRQAVQGNLDPLALFLPREDIVNRVGDIVRQGREAKGHVFNLGHGVIPETPVDAVKALVDAVHELSARK